MELKELHIVEFKTRSGQWTALSRDAYTTRKKAKRVMKESLAEDVGLGVFKYRIVTFARQ